MRDWSRQAASFALLLGAAWGSLWLVVSMLESNDSTPQAPLVILAVVYAGSYGAALLAWPESANRLALAALKCLLLWFGMALPLLVVAVAIAGLGAVPSARGPGPAFVLSVLALTLLGFGFGLRFTWTTAGRIAATLGEERAREKRGAPPSESVPEACPSCGERYPSRYYYPRLPEERRCSSCLRAPGQSR